jgi:hypothetical protein
MVRVARVRSISFVILATAALGCGGSSPPPSTDVHAALSATDRTHAGQAAAYAGKVTHYREIARQQRQLSAEYARWTPPARTNRNWNETLRAKADARAAAADGIAANMQRLTDFHIAEAAKEAGR